MREDQLKCQENYADYNGRIVVAGDVYQSQEEEETFRFVFFYVPELYRFVWLEISNYRHFTGLDEPARQWYLQQHSQHYFIELDQVFCNPLEPEYFHEGNLFITPEKFNSLPA